MLFEVLPIMLVFGIPFFAIWTSHKRKMAEIQLRGRDTGDTGVRAEVEALRQEIRSLRDTTMQYDLSFDTALQRMEQRMDGLDRRVQAIQPADMLSLGNGR